MKEVPTIKELVEAGALFVVNHSGGKDSQAMYLELSGMIPASQIYVVHADLPGADWPGTVEHIRNTSHGHPFSIVRAKKTFFGMVRHRGMWPSPKYRQCTSDLKRGPIEKAIRHYVKDHGLNLVVNCMGIRAEESPNRAKAITFKFNKKNSKAGRIWYDWLPIHDWKIDQVFNRIREAGESPHWAYSKGMSRLSCIFCIMSSKQDLKTAAKLQPDLFQEYVSLEKEIDHTFIMPGKKFLSSIDRPRKFLEEIVNG